MRCWPKPSPASPRPIGGETITVFEILTAVTFLLFSEQPADAAIIEVGLGGRFDATNVITDPAVSLIMPVSLDHEAYLGDRVELIAAEKAGIIKTGCPVVVGAQETEAAQAVLVETAERLGSPVTVYGQDFLAYEENGRMVYQDEHGLMDLPSPVLPGRHQYANAAAAIAAVRAAGFEIGHAAAERAMKTGLLAGPHAAAAEGQADRAGARRRRDLARRRPQSRRRPCRRRGAGRAGGEAAAAAVPDLRHDQHQGPDRLFPRLRGHGPPRLHCAGQPVGRRRSEQELAIRAQEAGLSAEPVASVANALMLLRDTWDDSEMPPRILIGGSLYLAGAVLAENGTPPV